MTEEERRQWDRDYSRQRHEQDPVKVNASKLAYYYRNAAKLNGDRCTWGKLNPEKEGIRVSLYQKKHPDKCVLHTEKRRAQKYANTPISEMLTSTEWLAILALADGHCAYCDKEAKLTLDHVVPLSKGGKHSAGNVVPACKHCNSSKGNTTLEEWNASRSTT